MAAHPEGRKQITISDVVSELTDAQARRIVAILGLADPARRKRQDADGPQLPDSARQLGA